VGVGKNGYADFPVQTVFGEQIQKIEVKIDEETLKIISQKTGGTYYRATDNEKLKNIYEEINKLEKDKIKEKSKKVREERYMTFLIPAVILLVLEFLLRLTVLRSIP
jgi:Ca-activated chloride channel family protein